MKKKILVEKVKVEIKVDSKANKYCAYCGFGRWVDPQLTRIKPVRKCILFDTLLKIDKEVNGYMRCPACLTAKEVEG